MSFACRRGREKKPLFPDDGELAFESLEGAGAGGGVPDLSFPAPRGTVPLLPFMP
jgi:hypothetical protein